MHGWYPESRPLDRPERLFDVTMGRLRDHQYWVTTLRQADFLKGLGFRRSRAIGLPLVYVPEPRVAREKDSLLVMPAHSLPAHDRASATAEYVAAIRALRPSFRRICVCVNGHDWERGNWVPEFRAAGLEVVRGAGDGSSLERVAGLFSRFDCVTTNGFGSLLAYASAFGARASIYGPFSAVTPESLKNVPFYIDNPELMAGEERAYSEICCRETFPELFCHPAEAQERVAWGRAETGWHNKASPEELRQLFGWTAAGRARSRIRMLGRRAQEAVPQPLKDEVRERLTPELRSRRRERHRLESMGAGQPGSTPLFGAPFEFDDARAFLEEYEVCFVTRAYRFRATSDRPLVVDAAAGTGLAVLSVKSLYPRSRIVAFEAAPATFDRLARNCRAYGLDDVELVCGDLSLDVLTRGQAAEMHAAAAPVAAGADSPGAALFVFGGDPVERIDLLRLRVGASQAAGMAELPALLANVESLAVDYSASADEPQRLGPLLDLVEAAGFRIAVQSSDSTRTQPLVAIPAWGAQHSRLRILGFRV